MSSSDPAAASPGDLHDPNAPPDLALSDSTGTATTPSTGHNRLRTYASFLRAIVSLRRRLFLIAVTGATLFALCTVASSLVIQHVVDQVIVPRFEKGSVATGTVLVGCALIIIVGLLRAGAVVLRRSFAGFCGVRSAQTLTERVTDRYLVQPLSWHAEHSDGELIGFATVDVDTSVQIIAPLPFACGTLVMVVVATAWMFSTDVVLGAIAITVIPLLMVLNVMYERAVTKHFDDAQAALGRFTGAVHESFEGVQLVKAYGAEQRETQRLSDMADVIRDARVRAVRVRATFEALLDTVPTITNIAVVVIGSWRVSRGHLSVGELSASIYMFTLLVLPLRLIGYAMSELPRSTSGYQRVRDVLNEPVLPDPADTLGQAPPGTAVEFRNVSYVFPDAAQSADGTTAAAINDASLVIAPGTVTAIVGPTGSGKSTLIDLIGGLVPAASGKVFVGDGERSIVFQEPFLFSGTIRDNVIIGARRGERAAGGPAGEPAGGPAGQPATEFTDRDVWQALQAARADEFVAELPEGLDTVVGERGVTLSGGQRQRIALARALVRRPSLLLLDDTTSALDPSTERAVLDNLRRFNRALSPATALDPSIDPSLDPSASTTIVMVASRPSTVALADDVIVVERGAVTDHGTHADLMQRAPGYRALVEAFETDRNTGGETVSGTGSSANAGTP